MGDRIITSSMEQKYIILWNNKAEEFMMGHTSIGFTGCNVWELTSIFREFIWKSIYSMQLRNATLQNREPLCDMIQKTETLYNEQK
jgi:hypothetical protein